MDLLTLAHFLSLDHHVYIFITFVGWLGYSIGQWRDSNDLPFGKTVGNCKPDIFTEKPMPVLLYKFYTYNLSPSKNLSHGFTSKKDDKEKTLGTLQKGKD